MAGAHSFGRYRVTGTLGSGAMGDVYAAVDEVLGREVAVKTLKGGQVGLAARMLDERFRVEARAIAALAHPGVVQVYDIDLSADPPYLVMERVEGPSLKEQLQKSGPFSNSQLRALGIQIANALAAAHAAKILHRDVKPANILAAGTGRWKLADFGVAHVPDSSLTMTGQFVGSPAYAPPEALVRGQSGPEGDVFGLGATLYQAAAAKWPRAEATTGGLLSPVQPLRELAPHVDEAIAEAIDRACAIEPAQRPTAAELAELLASGARSSGPIASVPASGPTMMPVAMMQNASTNPGSGPVSGRVSSPAVMTEFVSDESRPGVAATPLATIGGISGTATDPVPRKRVPWKPIAIGAGIIGVLVIIALVNDGGKPSDVATNATNAGGASGPKTGAKPIVSDPSQSMETPDPEEGPEEPDEHRIKADPPETDDPRAMALWNEIARRVNGGDIRNARHLLSEYERVFGQTSETRSLATQLDDVLEKSIPPGHRKSHKKNKR